MQKTQKKHLTKQHPFVIKTFSKLAIKRQLPQPTKRNLQKPTANIIINDERMHAFLLISGTI